MFKGKFFKNSYSSEYSQKYVPYFKAQDPFLLPDTKNQLCSSDMGYFSSVCLDRKTNIINWETEIDRCTKIHVQCTVSPFCTPHNYPSMILKVSNGYVVSGNTNVKYQVFNDKYVLQSQLNPYDDDPNVGLDSNIKDFRVVEVNTPLATAGIAYFDNEFAHFPLEYLPQILRLYHSLPKDVTILWPQTQVSKKIYNELGLNGLIDLERKVIFAEENTIYRSKSLYFHHFQYKKSVVSPVNIMLANQILTKKFEDEKPENTILLVSRKDRKTRQLLNHDEIKSRLTQKFSPQGYKIVEIVGGDLEWFEAGKHFYNAKLIISPHGATLSHLLFSRSCSSVIEVGYIPLSDEYFCLGRNIGNKYGFIITEGSYTKNMLPDINQIIELSEQLLSKNTC